jgi:hypothetical protein
MGLRGSERVAPPTSFDASVSAGDELLSPLASPADVAAAQEGNAYGRGGGLVQVEPRGAESHPGAQELNRG